jgi:TPR repeat protein
MMMLVLISVMTETKQVSAFTRVINCTPKFTARVVSALHGHRCQRTLCTTPENDAFYTELSEEIEVLARELWDGVEIPRLKSSASTNETTNPEGERAVSVLFEGEAGLPGDIPFSERGDYYRREALKGCPSAQHSYGLLLWSGFAGIEQNPEESAKFHAAAACQHHLDGMAVFGGCLRTGTGIPKKKKHEKKTKTTKQKRTANTVALGLKAIDFCASQAVGNPTGVNKQAALLESNGDDFRAVELYEACWRSGRANALLLFNLGWCLLNLNGRGVDRNDSDRDRGISLWKEATEMAPDEGSEEAAWKLYQEYARDDPQEAQHWLDLAEELGYCE